MRRVRVSVQEGLSHSSCETRSAECTNQVEPEMPSALHPSSYRSQESGRGVADAPQRASGNAGPTRPAS